jgi:phosphate butyryltransferase
LLKAASAVGPKTVAVAAANDHETLSAVVEAKKKGIAESVLVGNREWIDSILKKLGANPEQFKRIDERDAAQTAALAVSLVTSGEADILMKGNVVTTKFLHAALGGSKSLRTGGLLSDVEVYEDARRRGGHLMIMSDGGINIAPGIREKLQIIHNAVAVAHRLGIKRPKVALLSGSERVHPDFQSTIDAVALVKMCQQGEAGDSIVDGPFALDNAIDMPSARAKGIESPVAGRADVLIMPSLEAGNIFGKGLQYYGGLELAHVAMGAKAPILIPSRTAPARTKLNSLALAAMICPDDRKTRKK